MASTSDTPASNDHPPPLASADAESIRTQLQAPAIVARPTPPSTVIWHALSGTVGSLLAECVLFPVDTIKLQVQVAAADDQRGFFATLVRVLEQRGIAGLYGGLSGAMFKEFIHSLNFWLFHGLLFRYVAKFDDTSKTSTVSRLILNTVAKQLNWLCTVPFEAVSTVNQLAENNPGFFPTALTMYRSGGLGVFYRGLPVSLILAINPAIMNTLITTLLKIATTVRQSRGEDYLDSRDHGPGTVGLATALAKAVATIATYPLIRAKVLQQTSGKAISLAGVLKDVLATEGVKGLYRGVVAMSYKTVLWNTLMMAVKHVLGPKRAVTPPGSPAPRAKDPMGNMGSHVALLSREPFPAEMVTSEKLHEILEFLHVEHSPQQKRIGKLEQGLAEATQEMREVKLLLKDVATAVYKSNMNASNGAGQAAPQASGTDTKAMPAFPTDGPERRVSFEGDGAQTRKQFAAILGSKTAAR